MGFAQKKYDEPATKMRIVRGEEGGNKMRLLSKETFFALVLCIGGLSWYYTSDQSDNKESDMVEIGITDALGRNQPGGQYYPQSSFQPEYLTEDCRAEIDQFFGCSTILLWDEIFNCGTSYNGGSTKMVPVISVCTGKIVGVVYLDGENGAIEIAEMCENPGAVGSNSCEYNVGKVRHIGDACCNKLGSLGKEKRIKSLIQKALENWQRRKGNPVRFS